MKTGDVILIPFPYAEANDVKVRPAVVVTLTKDKYKDIVVCAISSVLPKQASKFEILLSPSSKNKLRIKSVLKVDRIVTLIVENKIADLGELDSKDLSAFIKTFKSLVD